MTINTLNTVVSELRRGKPLITYTANGIHVIYYKETEESYGVIEGNKHLGVASTYVLIELLEGVIDVLAGMN